MFNDLPFDDIFVKGTPYEVNRNRIKELFWLSNPENNVYADEKEDIYVIKKVDFLMVIGYLHCGVRPFGLGLGNDLLDFITDIKKLCKTKSWLNFELFIILDFRLRLISPETIILLPRDIKYFLLELHQLLNSPPKDPIEQKLENELSDSIRRSKVVFGSSILDEDPNSESAIMRALENGYGDLYGL